ncbi:TIR domain-containing protein [Leptothoe sp. PORK10 BA2]|uniref:TIR domain-containing protein n=1 Tax=Leptothoe sp. PORK10 BA2 TaxID=3110254 RepID=UPI002B21E2EF|nr:TIR domain-containing protein [Leptothoe sp. PORK10 BA2]MEA5463871.1 TIR domain-containing protein [Leptothoe sp. PORK10 BA2]
MVKPRDNDIFISYAAQDADFVRRLDKVIRDQGFDPWIDFDDIPGFNRFLEDDSHYERQIRDGILGADVFVLVLSKAVLSSANCVQRLRLAQRLNKLIILLFKEPSDDCDELISCLDDLHYLDLSSPLVGKVFEQVALNIIHLQTYTRLLARATEWDKQGRPQQYLLTPEDLKEVKKQKQWIETHKLGQQFQFTNVQKIFLDTVNRVHETSEYFSKSPPDIFISYARSNKHFVEKLSQALKAEHWKVWLDRDRIPVAANWRDEANDGIRYAHTMLFVVCADSLISKNCQWEWEEAKKYNKRIIPVISYKDYSQEVFREMGFSSVQYVSFVRQSQSFEYSLGELLDALKVHLDDLKTYRSLLVKAYEWSDGERSDRLLMNSHEYKEINRWRKQRQGLEKQDNREIELLLPRQKEYIQASQRYLSFQKKRQGLIISTVLGAMVGLSVLLLSTTFSEIRALVRSLDDLKGLDALLTGLQAGKRVQDNSIFVDVLRRSSLRSKATTALHRTALKLREINRFEGHDGKVFSIIFSPGGNQLVSVGADKTVRFWDLDNSEEEEIDQSCQKERTQQIGYHSTAIRTITYSLDSDYVATGDIEGVVKIWTCNGKLHKTLSRRHQLSGDQNIAQPARVNRVEFSPGGQYLASAGADGQVFLWTRSDGFRNLVDLKHKGQVPISTLTFSSNGRYLASADSQGQVYLWEVKHKRKSLPAVEFIKSFQYKVALEGRNLTTLVFSKDSSLLAFAGVSGAIQVEDLKQGANRLLMDHDDVVSTVIFSADGGTLASASFDGTVKLWNPRGENGKELVHTLRGHQGPVYRLAFAPQDDVLATGGADGIVRLWLRDKGVQIGTFEGHKDEISSLAFSPQPTLGYKTVLVSSSDDGSIRLWNIDSPIQPLPHNSDVFDVAFRPDGKIIASGGVNTVRLWRQDGTSRSQISFARNKVRAVDYSPDGKILAAGGSSGEIRLWRPDIDTEKPIQIVAAHPVLKSEVSVEQGVRDLSFSRDGQWLASAGTDRTLKLWRVEDDQIYRYLTLEHANDVAAVAFSHDSRLLITGTEAGSDAIQRGVFLWETPDLGRSKAKLKPKFVETARKHDGSVLTVAVQPTVSGVIASGGKDGKINLWNSEGGFIKTLHEHSDPVTKVSFSADGLFLASSSEDGTIRLWTAKGDLISVLEGHKRAVSSVEFGPIGGDILASSSSDENALIWNLWDLSKVNITTRNQNHKILDMLIMSGCETILPFLKSRVDTDAQEVRNLTSSDTEQLAEIEKVKNFCESP